MKVIAIVSGGMDSVTLAHYYASKADIDSIHMVSFDYGQRHKKELEFANLQAAWLNDRKVATKHTVVDLTNLTKLIGGSSLTQDDIEVPDGHYSEESMKITVVPNRNMIMLSIAGGIAVAEEAAFVGTA